MNFDALKLPFSELGPCFLIGVICGVVFMYLLWRTVKLLPQVKHKSLFVFMSKALRFFLLLCVMILFSDRHPVKFLTIFCGFLTVRFVILKFVSFRVYCEAEEKQLLKGMAKKK